MKNTDNYERAKCCMFCIHRIYYEDVDLETVRSYCHLDHQLPKINTDLDKYKRVLYMRADSEDFYVDYDAFLKWNNNKYVESIGICDKFEASRRLKNKS